MWPRLRGAAARQRPTNRLEGEMAKDGPVGAGEGVEDVLAEMREAVAWCREGTALPGGRRTVSAERVEHWGARIGDAHAREVEDVRGMGASRADGRGVRGDGRGDGVGCKEVVADISEQCPKSDGTCPNGDGTCPDGGRNFPGAESDMAAENEGSYPAETQGEASDHVTFDTPSPTAELREWVEQAPKSFVDTRNPYNDEEYLTGNPETLLAIADRIDEAVAGMMTEGEHRRRMEHSGKALRGQNRRYREQIAQLRRDIQRGCDSEDELLAVIADVTRERDELLEKSRRRKAQLSEVQAALERRNEGELKRQWQREVDALKAKLAEVRAHSIELPRDADGKVIRFGDTVYNGAGKVTEVAEIDFTSDGRAFVGNWGKTGAFMEPAESMRHHDPNPSPYDAVRERFGVRAGDGSLISTVIDACEGVAGE